MAFRRSRVDLKGLGREWELEKGGGESTRADKYDLSSPGGGGVLAVIAVVTCEDVSGACYVPDAST